MEEVNESDESEQQTEEQSEQAEETVEKQSVTNEAATEEPVEEVIETSDSPDVRTEESEDTPPATNKDENTEESSANSPAIEESVVTEKVTPGGNNQGDDIEEVGDEGDPDGEIDERSLYGNPVAGSDGASLDMAGWMWDELPKPDDRSDEVGRIIFQIQVDADGYITSITRIQSTVTPAVESIYRSEIEQLTFHKIGGANAPRNSSGRITFIIRSN